MSDNYKDKADYVTAEDCRDLHSRAVATAERLGQKRKGKKFIYVKHPELPNTWLEKEVTKTKKA